MCVTAIVHSMGTKFANKEEIISGTRSEDSVTICLSSLRVLTEMYINIFLCLVVLFDKINVLCFVALLLLLFFCICTFTFFHLYRKH